MGSLVRQRRQSMALVLPLLVSTAAFGAGWLLKKATVGGYTLVVLPRRRPKVTSGTGVQQKSVLQTIEKEVQRRAISCLSRVWVTESAQGTRWSTVSTLRSIHTNACQSTKLNTRSAELVSGAVL